MAKKQQSGAGDDILLNIKVTGQEDLKDSRNDAKELNEELKNGGNTDISAGAKSLKTQLREAKLEAEKLFDAGKQGTKEYAEAAKKVTGLKNDMDELNNTFKSFDPDNKFRVFANAAGAGATAVQGYAGAMSFLGVSSDDTLESIAKLQGIMAFADAIDSLGDLQDSYNDVLRMLGLTTTATEGLGAAQKATAVTSRVLGTALKAIGIGLLVSALVYLISNFDKVKKVVTDLFPALGEAGGLFNKVKEVAFGLGNVILTFLVTPIKTFIKLIQLDFKGAVNEIKSSLDVVKNYTAGASKEAAKQAEAARIERVKGEIETNERLIKERKALGEDTYKLELANKRRELDVLDKSADDYLKVSADLQSEITSMQNSESKRRGDIAKAAREKAIEKNKEELAEIKAAADKNLEIIKSSSDDKRRIELNAIDEKYSAELSALKRLKAANVNYNTDLKNLLKARKIEENEINKKYDDAFNAYQNEAAELYFTEYERKEAEIKARAAELLKSVTPEQAGKVLATQAFLLGRNTSQSLAAGASQKANADLTNAENDNRPSDQDTPDDARRKIANLSAARTEAETAAYELRREQLAGQYSELEQLQADHEKTLTDIDAEEAEARKNIAAAEAENRLKMFDAVAQGAEAASGLIGESTLAGKALAVASASINTYAAIAGQLAAFAGVPIPGYAIAQAIATGLVGLAQVKKIMTVNVPGGSGGGAPSMGGGSAPVINSTVLSRERSGSDDVVSAVNDTSKTDKPMRAYIVNKDLDDQKEKAEYYESQSTY